LRLGDKRPSPLRMSREEKPLLEHGLERGPRPPFGVT
jgi:hypothetical protein